MDMKSSLQNSALPLLHSSSAPGFSNEEYAHINLDENHYLSGDSTSEQNGSENPFILANSKMGQSTDLNGQNEHGKVLPMVNPYYSYKPEGMLGGPQQPNQVPLQHQLEGQMLQSLPDFCGGQSMMPATQAGMYGSTGYEAVSGPCGCAYCLSYYHHHAQQQQQQQQQQWYMAYQYAAAPPPPPPPAYMLAPAPNPQSQQQPQQYRPLVMSKPPEVPASSAPGMPMFGGGAETGSSTHEVDQKLAHLTPVYINQPVPSNTEHFQRRTPFKKRDHNALSWLLLYLELEKEVDSPTMNARIAWINDMHHIIYTKLTSGLISRWQYEYDFGHLKNLISQKSMEADDMFKLFPRLCHCGERFKSEPELAEHSSRCIELKLPWHRCLCGQLFDQHLDFFQHIFSGTLHCPMAVYHLWIFFEKYRRRRYKCFCSVIFHNFWVYYVHMGECVEYQNYFQRNCYFCQETVKKASENSASFWSYPMVGPLKDLVRHSKIQ